MVETLADPAVVDVAGSGEKVAEFVERSGHDTVVGVEGFFDAVAVVDVDVDVEDAFVFSKG